MSKSVSVHNEATRYTAQQHNGVEFEREEPTMENKNNVTFIIKAI